jgi:hypothetical protein
MCLRTLCQGLAVRCMPLGKRAFLNLNHAWSLDDGTDGTVVGALTEVALVLDAVVTEGPDTGIFLDPSKTKE